MKKNEIILKTTFITIPPNPKTNTVVFGKERKVDNTLIGYICTRGHWWMYVPKYYTLTALQYVIIHSFIIKYMIIQSHAHFFI